MSEKVCSECKSPRILILKDGKVDVHTTGKNKIPCDGAGKPFIWWPETKHSVKTTKSAEGGYTQKSMINRLLSDIGQTTEKQS
jgi:hypothetical protein